MLEGHIVVLKKSYKRRLNIKFIIFNKV
jgi:hypothetical protein